VIDGFYIDKHYFSSKITLYFSHIEENLVVSNVVDLVDSPNCQNKFHTKFSSYMVLLHYNNGTAKGGLNEHMPFQF